MEQRFELAGVLAECGVIALRVEGETVRVLEVRRTDLPAEILRLAPGERVVGERGEGKGGDGRAWTIAIWREGESLRVEVAGEHEGKAGGDVAALREGIARLGPGFGGG